MLPRHEALIGLNIQATSHDFKVADYSPLFILRNLIVFENGLKTMWSGVFGLSQ
jgi:hypothetical protein